MVDREGDPRFYDGPIEEPDLERMFPANAAWLALMGMLDGGAERAAEIVAREARILSGQLDALRPNFADPLAPGQNPSAIKQASRLLSLVAELFGKSEILGDPEAALAFRAILTRNKGRPAKRDLGAYRLGWWFLAEEVEALIAQGLSQKAAVGKVAERLKLKDRIIAEWVRERRVHLNKAKAFFDDPGKSSI